MSEIPQESPEIDAEQSVPQVVKRRSMFDDPVVRRMTYLSVAIVLLSLVSVLSILVTGVVAPTGPRTLAEKQLVVSRDAVAAGATNPVLWDQYIAALIDDGQFSRARNVIRDGRNSLDESSTAVFTIGEARLYRAQGDYEKAIEAADRAIDILDEDLEVRKSSGGGVARRANVSGHHENYYVAILLKADAYRSIGQFESAIEQYDAYIEEFKGAADILIDRANAKVEIGDTKGAEEDFRRALKFLPDSAEAAQGLEKIGAER